MGKKLTPIAAVQAVQAALTPELLKPEYREANERHPLAGHCYVATEALFHLLGGRESEWQSMHTEHEGVEHWWLRSKADGSVLDATAEQFETLVPYDDVVRGWELSLPPALLCPTQLVSEGRDSWEATEGNFHLQEFENLLQ